MKKTFIALCAAALLAAASGCAVAAPAVPGDRIEVVADVGYYPACGNELLDLDGVTYYPLTTEESDAFPTPIALGGAGPHGYSRGVGLVAAPGPGDDIGTVIIYDGGYALFRSDSGNLERWLTTQEREYNWVC